jgi:hypothetical protein
VFRRSGTHRDLPGSCTGETLPRRLRQTVPDFEDLHGMQKVRGSNPLSSTPGQRPVPVSETGLLNARTAAKYSSRPPGRHPSVTVRTKIIFLMKASDVLDFDAKTSRAIMLNGGSDVSGLAFTSRDLGVLLWTAKTRLRFSAIRPPRSRGIRSHCGGLVVMRQLGACRVIHRCGPPMLSTDACLAMPA